MLQGQYWAASCTIIAVFSASLHLILYSPVADSHDRVKKGVTLHRPSKRRHVVVELIIRRLGGMS